MFLFAAIIGWLIGFVSTLFWNETRSIQQPSKEVQFDVHPHHLYYNHTIRILCWVPIRNYTNYDTIQRIRWTWGTTCDALYFTTHNSSILMDSHLVKLSFNPKGDLWNQIHPAWNYMEENFVQDFDFFAKVDDDTYFNADNLRLFCSDKSSHQVWYLGHYLHGAYIPIEDPTGKFNLGGAYVISKAALQQVGPFFPDSNKTMPLLVNGRPSAKCRRSRTWAEDIVFANCLRSCGIPGPNNSRDSHQRNHFMLSTPLDALQRVQRDDGWVWKGVPLNAAAGIHSSASRPISWHKVSLLALDYFMQRLRVDPGR
jgi:hypothetical protein